MYRSHPENALWAEAQTCILVQGTDTLKRQDKMCLSWNDMRNWRGASVCRAGNLWGVLKTSGLVEIFLPDGKWRGMPWTVPALQLSFLSNSEVKSLCAWSLCILPQRTFCPWLCLENFCVCEEMMGLLPPWWSQVRLSPFMRQEWGSVYLGCRKHQNL